MAEYDQIYEKFFSGENDTTQVQIADNTGIIGTFKFIFLQDNRWKYYLNECERIMACVDIYQALTESRPYKKGMTHEKAIGILEDMAQKGWLDKNIVLKTDECFSV